MHIPDINSIGEFFLKVLDAFRHFGFIDVLDIALVALLVYLIINKLRKTQSIQIILGVAGLLAIYGAVRFLNMSASRFLFEKVFADVIVIFAVIFAPELRRGLEGIGKGGFFRRIFTGRGGIETENVVSSITNAAKIMAGNKVGSLIIIQRDSLLGDLTGGGVNIDSLVSEEILGNIFYPKSPLHDGAVVIKDDRILAARCVVPIRDKATISSKYGTRHRAAIEVSHNSDAIVVVTSEERGQISYAKDGRLEQNITPGQLSAYLATDLGLDDGTERRTAPAVKQKKEKVKTVRVKAEKNSQPSGEPKITIDDIRLPGEEPETEPVPQPAQEQEIPSREALQIINEGEANDEQE